MPPPPPGNLMHTSCPTKCVCKELAAREPPKPCAISGRWWGASSRSLGRTLSTLHPQCMAGER